MNGLRAVQATWDELEPPVLRFLLKVILAVGAVVASPFLAVAFLLFLLDMPLLWVLIPLAVAVIVLTLALVGWAVVRAKIRAVRGHVDRARAIDVRLRGRDE